MARRAGPLSGTTTETTLSEAWPRGWAFAGAFVCLLLLAEQGARPVADGDLWNHLAYARQMVATATPIVDHSIFSWTPAANDVIYCAWLSQLVLFGVYSLGGLPALFALQYAVIATLPACGAWQAYRLGVLSHPVTWLAVALALVMSSASVFLKPQIVSVVLMSVAAVLTTELRTRPGPRWWIPYILPALMVVWVNGHGGFVVGLSYVVAVAAGEWLNARWAPSIALSAPLRRHLFIAVGLCFVATFVTPYGWRYPAQFFWVDLPAADLAMVRDYDSIFAPDQRLLHYAEYGAAMAGGLLTLWWLRRRHASLDWSLLLPNVMLASFYVYYARLTFFWAPVALFTAIALLAAPAPALLSTSVRGRPRIGAFATVGTLLVAGHAAWWAWQAPNVGTWIGFGNGYANPEDEAAYIGTHFPGARVGNDYNTGAYLIWSLWPGSRVFVDARYFPYRSWFGDYRKLETTNGIDALVKAHPADLWCIDLTLSGTVAWFRASPDWTAAFYGPSAVVFIRRDQPLPGGTLQVSPRIADMRNLYQGLLVFGFALDVSDLRTADQVVSGLETRFRYGWPAMSVAQTRRALEGVSAHARGDYGVAVTLLQPLFPEIAGVPRLALAESAAIESVRAWGENDLPQAWTNAQLAATAAPESVLTRFNRGVVRWWMQRQPGADADRGWRHDLEEVLTKTAGAGLGSAALTQARQIVDGSLDSRPFLLRPTPRTPKAAPD